MKVQFNSSTLKAIYNSVANKVQTVEIPEPCCPACIRVSFVSPTECASPNDLWPSAFPTGPFYLTKHVSSPFHSYAEGEDIGGDWFLDVRCHVIDQVFIVRVYCDTSGMEDWGIAFSATNYGGCDNRAIAGVPRTNCFTSGDCGGTHMDEGSVNYLIIGHGGMVLIEDMSCTVWNSSTTYGVNSVVMDSNKMYICILNHTNHKPPNTTYWTRLA